MKNTIKNFATFVMGMALIMASGMGTVDAHAEILTKELEVENPYSIAACVAAAREVESNLIDKSMQAIEVENDMYRVFVYKDKDGDVVTEIVRIDRSGDGWQQLIDAFAHLQEL